MNQTSKTILMVAPYFPPAGGGLERYAFEIARRLQKDYAWRVVVITSGERYGQDETNDSALTVYRLGYRFKFSNTPFALVGCQNQTHFKSRKSGYHQYSYASAGDWRCRCHVCWSQTARGYLSQRRMHKGRLSSDLFIWLYEHGTLRFILRRANAYCLLFGFCPVSILRRYLTKVRPLPRD